MADEAAVETTGTVLVKPETILDSFKKNCIVRIDTLETDKRMAAAIKELSEMEIANAEDFSKVDEAKQSLKRLVRFLEKEEIGPLRDAFHKAHKDIVAFLKDKTAEPNDAVRAADKKLDAYTAEQDRLRREEEKRLAEIQRKKIEAEQKQLREEAEAEAKRQEEIKRKEAEAKALEDALAAEEAGKKEETERILATPVEVEPVTPEPVAAPIPVEAPKLQSAPVRKGKRENWGFEVEDSEKIPHTFMKVDEVLIGQHVRIHKEKTLPGCGQDIPGVKTFIK